MNPNANVFKMPDPASVGEKSAVAEDSDFDENDKLWKACLSICDGDKKRATSMIENPDELMKYSEIRALLEEEGEDDDDWEKRADDVPKEKQTPLVGGNDDVSDIGIEPKSSSISVEKAKASSPEISQGMEENVYEDIGEIEEIDSREHLNIVFIGHVDAGKSTLSGSILYIMGMVDKRTIEKYEREAKERNRESWFLAFIMDTSEEERAKGKTVEVGRAHFDTDVNRYTILDAPGHKNYVPNMIAGAAQADVAVLVISARRGEFETGFEKGGQTREHALLAKTLGVRFLLVVINKMDDSTVQWNLGRYEECVAKLKPYLKSCGYAIKRDVRFLPVSALTGDNIRKEVSYDVCSWWKDLYSQSVHNTSTPTLISTLDSLIISGRDPTAPLRIPCIDRYLERGTVMMGKVESGTIRMNDVIAIAPTKKQAKVEALYIDERKVHTAKPGENILLKLTVGLEDIQRGFVICSPDSLCPAVTEIQVQLALVDLLEHRPLFSPGYECVLHVHSAEIEVTCTRIVSVIENQKHVRKPFAKQGQMCIAVLGTGMSTCMETYEVTQALGRITLRDEGQTIAIGKVTKLIR